MVGIPPEHEEACAHRREAVAGSVAAAPPPPPAVRHLLRNAWRYGWERVRCRWQETVLLWRTGRRASPRRWGRVRGKADGGQVGPGHGDGIEAMEVVEIRGRLALIDGGDAEGEQGGRAPEDEEATIGRCGEAVALPRRRGDA